MAIDRKVIIDVIRDAALIVLAAGIVAFVGNALRTKGGLPLVAQEEYEIFVPCPESLGKVELLAVGAPELGDPRSLIVDARSPEEFAAWHYQGAENIVYDYLDPIPEDELKAVIKNIAKSGKARVIVYGDGDGTEGTTGYELGRELSAKGINNVYVIKGGTVALKEGNHD